MWQEWFYSDPDSIIKVWKLFSSRFEFKRFKKDILTRIKSMFAFCSANMNNSSFRFKYNIQRNRIPFVENLETLNKIKSPILLSIPMMLELWKKFPCKLERKREWNVERAVIKGHWMWIGEYIFSNGRSSVSGSFSLCQN